MASIITSLGRPLGRNSLRRFFSSSTIKATASTTTTTSTANIAITTPFLRKGLSRTYFSSSQLLPLSSPFRHSSTFFTPRFTTTTTTVTRSARIPPSRPQKLNYSTTSRSKPSPSSPEEPTSLSARLKKLSREYGYAALAVYFGLSALDFPFCFLAVRYLGTERIGKLEERAVGYAKRALVTIEEFIGIKWHTEKAVVVAGNDSGGVGIISEAEKKKLDNEGKEGDSNGPSLWTELVLAYAIHKSLIFIRVPLAAAVTPKVVKVLRGWGWDIGKKGGVREGVMELKRKVD